MDEVGIIVETARASSAGGRGFVAIVIEGLAGDARGSGCGGAVERAGGAGEAVCSVDDGVAEERLRPPPRFCGFLGATFLLDLFMKLMVWGSP